MAKKKTVKGDRIYLVDDQDVLAVLEKHGLAALFLWDEAGGKKVYASGAMLAQLAIENAARGLKTCVVFTKPGSLPYMGMWYRGRSGFRGLELVAPIDPKLRSGKNPAVPIEDSELPKIFKGLRGFYFQPGDDTPRPTASLVEAMEKAAKGE